MRIGWTTLYTDAALGACVGLPAQEQAALALMAPSMVHKSSQGELGLLLLETLMEEQHKSRKLNQHARMAVLAALTQIEITDTDACSRIVTRLSAVRVIRLSMDQQTLALCLQAWRSICLLACHTLAIVT